MNHRIFQYNDYTIGASKPYINMESLPSIEVTNNLIRK